MLPTQYQTMIHQSRYARWREEDGRRETWEETVDRYISFFMHKCIDLGVTEIPLNELRAAIYSLDVMPSMRCLMTAGEALERDNVAGYNCAYLAVDSMKAFDEAMYILMCGTGVGFSVERQYVSLLPPVAEEFHDTDSVLVVKDSKIGWATAYRELLSFLYAGKVPRWDLSKVRPSGARLKTFGGRASGPAPLDDLFKFSVEIFRRARGRKLSSLECHDLMCKVADAIVVGGVRRSALISLSNLTDERMRGAKAGQWWETNSQRALANNSVCYTEKPDPAIFLKEWTNLYESKCGERGIFNRTAAKNSIERSGRRSKEHDFGTNPCSEIILRNKQFCNLTEVVIRPGDTLDVLKEKVKYAAILGTLQATLTNFRYLSREWRKNTEEERLLGVSLTGIMDHPFLSGQNPYAWGSREEPEYYENGEMSRAFSVFPKYSLPDILTLLKEVAIETNVTYAGMLGIPPSTSITCVKPSGTVSQLVNSSSGIHARFAPYYLRTVRNAKTDPLSEFLIAAGIPHETAEHDPYTWVFAFPVFSPEGAVVGKTRTALEQLELWRIYNTYWCEHKPSITVFYTDEEFLDVGAWVYSHFDEVSGVSFLPHSDHIYKQAPYQELTKEQYEEALSTFPTSVPWESLSLFEKEDNTTASHELACSAGGSCEV